MKVQFKHKQGCSNNGNLIQFYQVRPWFIDRKDRLVLVFACTKCGVCFEALSTAVHSDNKPIELFESWDIGGSK